MKLAVSTKEAAELIGVSPDTIRKLVRVADFPSIRLGGRTLIPTEPLKQWLVDHTGDNIKLSTGR